MNREVAAAWSLALRSGRYRPGTARLVGEGRDGGALERDALGVLCELAVEAGIIPPAIDGAYAGATEVLPPAVTSWAELEDDDPTIRPVLHDPETWERVSSLNDAGVPHHTIGCLIADHWEEM